MEETVLSNILATWVKSYDHIYTTLKAPSEKCKMVSFASLIMRSFVAPAAPAATFPVKFICSIAFGRASKTFCLLNSIAMTLR